MTEYNVFATIVITGKTQLAKLYSNLISDTLHLL